MRWLADSCSMRAVFVAFGISQDGTAQYDR